MSRARIPAAVMTLAFSLSFWNAARPDSLRAQGGAPIQRGIREGNFSAAESTTPFPQFVSQGDAKKAIKKAYGLRLAAYGEYAC